MSISTLSDPTAKAKKVTVNTYSSFAITKDKINHGEYILRWDKTQVCLKRGQQKIGYI